MTKATIQLVSRLQAMGFTLEEALQLRRIERTLHRWSELECNGIIQRDEETGIPLAYRDARFLQANDPRQFRVIADREKGALKRLDKLMAAHPDFVAYHQGDPRGCALYIVAKKDLRPGECLDAVYTRGLAVCD